MKPGEHKTVQARILVYAEAIGGLLCAARKLSSGAGLIRLCRLPTVPETAPSSSMTCSTPRCGNSIRAMLRQKVQSGTCHQHYTAQQAFLRRLPEHHPHDDAQIRRSGSTASPVWKVYLAHWCELSILTTKIEITSKEKG